MAEGAFRFTFYASLLRLRWSSLSRGSPLHSPRDRQPSRPAPDILVVRFSAIGDILLTTPLLRAIRTRYPGARIAVLTKERYVPLLSHNPHVNEVLGIGPDERVSRHRGADPRRPLHPPPRPPRQSPEPRAAPARARPVALLRQAPAGAGAPHHSPSATSTAASAPIAERYFEAAARPRRRAGRRAARLLHRRGGRRARRRAAGGPRPRAGPADRGDGPGRGARHQALAGGALGGAGAADRADGRRRRASLGGPGDAEARAVGSPRPPARAWRAWPGRSACRRPAP